ncbi:succinate dehydrogenase assembly factor 2 [Rhodocyclus gracilis]|uniref:FAD assembly factor SdhE n=1 Tax=Rhodocyclus gracilis TaxID=2929842 RepID=UPI0030F38E1B
MDRDALNRLRWRCTRRALLELDLLLGHFLDTRFADLDEAQAQEFAELADLEDFALWPLINGDQEPKNPQQAAVLAMLRSSRTRNPA